MALVMKDVFGDLLVTTANTPARSTLPTLKEMEGRVLIKGKLDFSCDTDDFGSNNNESRKLEKEITSRSSISSLKSLIDPVELRFKLRRTYSKVLAGQIVFFKGIPFNNPIRYDNLDFDQMYSFTDRKAASLFTKEEDNYRIMTALRMLRVYPSIIRVDSSNYDPVSHWYSGAQMVALNFQTADRAMDLNNALFKLNCNYGYVLKPLSLNQGNSSQSVSITIISAQQINRGDMSVNSDTLRAEVTLEVIGHADDNIKVRTTAVKSNGFNPVWKQELRVNIKYSQLCFLRFEVNDVERLSTLGSFTIMLACLARGYRHVFLNNKEERHSPCTILIHSVTS